MADITLNVFVGNTTMIDAEVYQLWLDGYSGWCEFKLTNFGAKFGSVAIFCFYNLVSA